jgi:hypothetical protein
VLGQSVTDEELHSNFRKTLFSFLIVGMIKMVGVLSKDKITYHEFKEFFKKDD